MSNSDSSVTQICFWFKRLQILEFHWHLLFYAILISNSITLPKQYCNIQASSTSTLPFSCEFSSSSVLMCSVSSSRCCVLSASCCNMSTSANCRHTADMHFPPPKYYSHHVRILKCTLVQYTGINLLCHKLRCN